MILNRRYLSILATTLLCGSSISAIAMQSITDEQMAEVSGSGLAFSLDGFRFQMAPTSYIEQVGDVPSGGTSFNRGDLRWYGAAISSSTGSGLSFNNTACTIASGLNSMGCPMTTTGIANYANHNNPFLLRVFDYTRVGWNGSDWVGAPVTGTPGSSAGGVSRTVLEILGPSKMDTFRWSFWGEILVSSTDPQVDPLGSLQNQNIINGKPAAVIKPPSLSPKPFGQEEWVKS